MPPRIMPKKVMTPGSYRIPTPSWKTPQGKTTPKGKTTPQGKTTPPGKKTPPPVKKAGHKKKKVRKARGNVKHRAAYTEDDMLEAIRLVRREKLSIQKAAKVINEEKTNIVPRHGVIILRQNR
jgi:hypothetical protein